MTNVPEDRRDAEANRARADPIRFVRDAIAGMRFGAIQLTVHEGKLVQIDVTEKRRFS